MPSGDQKAVVKKDTLPPVSLLSDGNYGYIVRYRIVSEDQNRFSQWSPIRELSGIDIDPVEGDVVIAGLSIQVVWGDDNVGRNYDVFVKFDTDTSFQYHGTTSIHTYSLLAKSGASTVEVAVQISSSEQEYAPSLIIWDTDAPEDLVSLS